MLAVQKPVFQFSEVRCMSVQWCNILLWVIGQCAPNDICHCRLGFQMSNSRTPYTCPICAPGSNAFWLICWFWRRLNCLFNKLPSDYFLPSSYFLLFLYFLPDLFTSLLVYFLTYLSTLSRIGPFCFLAGDHRRRPGQNLVFLGSFCVVVYFVMDVCLLCCVSLSFSVLSQEIGWEERLWNDLFCKPSAQSTPYTFHNIIVVI